MTAPAQNQLACHKVVIRFDTEVVKAYLASRACDTLGELLQTISERVPDTLYIRRLGSDVEEALSVEDAKAIFFVKSFDGDGQRTDLKFHTRTPIVHGIWMRLEFLDGEEMEGITQNTIHYLVNPGFFLYPTDPRSNNQLVYVMKKQLKDLRVLGLRAPACVDDDHASPFAHLCAGA